MYKRNEIIEEIKRLYDEISEVQDDILRARLENNSEKELKALRQMESLAIGVQQDLMVIRDYIEAHPTEESITKISENMKIRIKKLTDNAVMPKKAHPTDAGFDLYATKDYVIQAHGRCLIDTGIAMDVPLGYYGMVVGRSGNTIKRGLVGMTGIIDSGYQDSIGIMAFNMTDADIEIKQGERAGQILIVPHLPCHFDESDEFTVVNRNGGFGSTGR